MSIDLFRLFSEGEQETRADGMLASAVDNLIKQELDIFNQAVSITNQNTLPDTQNIPIEKPTHWLKIPNVICCFVDMEGSTKLSASLHDKSTAKAYRLFTETAIRIFAEFDAAYIDVKGDGVFALFDDDKPYTALAATVSFKTFVAEWFTPKIKQKTDLEIGGHFGIDQKTVLVRKFGFKRHNGRTDRQNEVWAGKPVNMAAKLASMSTGNRLWVSDRYFKNLEDEKALLSCGCLSGEKKSLWQLEDLSQESKFDFDIAHSLGSNWCSKHGKSFCAALVKLDE